MKKREVEAQRKHETLRRVEIEKLRQQDAQVGPACVPRGVRDGGPVTRGRGGGSVPCDLWGHKKV